MRKTDLIIKLMENVINEKEMEHLKSVLDTVLQEPDQSPDTEELISKYKMTMKLTGRKDTSILQYELEIRSICKIINKNPCQMTAADVKEYLYNYQEEKGISMVTMQNKLRYLSSFFEYLLNEGYIQRNPTKQIGRVICPVKLKRAFTDEDLEAIRSVCHIKRDRALIEFLYATGARVSEVTILKVSDIDFQKKELILFGKGHKERMAYIDDIASEYILDYLSDRDPDLNDPLFSDLNQNRKITSRAIEKILWKLGDEAGVTNVHPHRFRRTYATNLWKQGVPVETIRILMGHTNVATTLKYIDIDNTSVKAQYEMAKICV